MDQEAMEPDMEQWTGSKLGKGYIKAVYWHPVYLTYIQSTSMWNARLNKSQAGIKVARRNINFRYADDTTLMAESEEEIKSLLMIVKEESEKTGLELNIQKTWHPVPSLHGKQRQKVKMVADFIFLGSKISADSDCNHEVKRCLLLGRKAITNSLLKKQRHHFDDKSP